VGSPNAKKEKHHLDPGGAGVPLVQSAHPRATGHMQLASASK